MKRKEVVVRKEKGTFVFYSDLITSSIYKETLPKIF